jgi:predicted nucleic acid-binding protein
MPVVDASVVVDWIAPGISARSPAMRLLANLSVSETKLLAPRLLLEEASNALLTGVRQRRWTGAAADGAHMLLREMPVDLLDDARDLARAWELARRYDNHPVYDLLYVALAERLGEQLITADAGLRRRLVDIDWLVAPEDLL